MSRTDRAARLNWGGSDSRPSWFCYLVRLTSIRLVFLLLSATCTTGAFGLNGIPFGVGGFCGPNAPVSIRNRSVFLAAPFKTTLSAAILQSGQLYSPPAYVRTAAANSQSVQFIPSNGCSVAFPRFLYANPCWDRLEVQLVLCLRHIWQSKVVVGGSAFYPGQSPLVRLLTCGTQQKIRIYQVRTIRMRLSLWT